MEDILRMLSNNKRYRETHNAVLDAQDELEIIRLLGHGIEEYQIACLSDKKAPNTKAQHKTKIIEKPSKKKGIILKIFRRK